MVSAGGGDGGGDAVAQQSLDLSGQPAGRDRLLRARERAGVDIGRVCMRHAAALDERARQKGMIRADVGTDHAHDHIAYHSKSRR